MTEPALAIIVVAAGSGTRLAAGAPKAFVQLGGRTVLEHALAGVLGSSQPAQVIVVAPASHVAQAQAIAARLSPEYVEVVRGGASRQDSVAAGLAAIRPGVRTVLVHDAARALTPSGLFDRVAGAVASTGLGIVPALPVSDTIKRVADGSVVETVERSSLVHVQTPQGFPREQLVAAYAAADHEYTDDAALYAAAGHQVDVVEGEALAFKITTPWDLRRAETMLGPDTGIRTGVGIDVHAYDAAQPLWLGGLYWPDEVGLAGHSDGDVMMHAVCDALLSAAGLGDIGARFGTDDPRYAGVHGEVFLRETIALVEGAGFRVGNVAVQLIAKHPKLGDRRLELEAHLTALTGAPVSVAATTSDGLGFTGRAEGAAVIATALLHRL